MKYFRNVTREFKTSLKGFLLAMLSRNFNSRNDFDYLTDASWVFQIWYSHILQDIGKFYTSVMMQNTHTVYFYIILDKNLMRYVNPRFLLDKIGKGHEHGRKCASSARASAWMLHSSAPKDPCEWLSLTSADIYGRIPARVLIAREFSRLLFFFTHVFITVPFIQPTALIQTVIVQLSHYP